ncbi:hypothetical protein, partial [Mycobacterium sp.]|uniref:hypothetical protein n=1 Tax=Mycobacterium sp. TaxID=1785 RepID=UPI003BB02C16
MNLFEQYAAELEAASGSTVDQKASLEEFLGRADASLQESAPLGQGWFRGLAHRLTRAVSYKDEPTLLSAETALRNLYATSKVANGGERDDSNATASMTEAFILAGLEIAGAGLAAIGTDVGADYVEGSALRKEFLSVVAGTPDISGRILASRLGKGEKPLDEGQLSRVAKGLHDRGLVDRRKVGQRVLWRLTPRGSRVFDVLQLSPEFPVNTELVTGSAENLTELLSSIDLENVEKPVHLTKGSATLTAVPQQEGYV